MLEEGKSKGGEGAIAGEAQCACAPGRPGTRGGCRTPAPAGARSRAAPPSAATPHSPPPPPAGQAGITNRKKIAPVSFTCKVCSTSENLPASIILQPPGEPERARFRVRVIPSKGPASYAQGLHAMHGAGLTDQFSAKLHSKQLTAGLALSSWLLQRVSTRRKRPTFTTLSPALPPSPASPARAGCPPPGSLPPAAPSSAISCSPSSCLAS